MWLDSLDYELHIIILTEVWVKQQELHRFQLKGYNTVLEENEFNKAGGILMYINNHITFSHSCKTYSTMNMIRCNLKLSKNYSGIKKERSISVLGIYRFCGSSVLTFLDDLENEIKTLEKNCILTGDINLDLLDRENSQCYIDLLHSHGFSENFCKITRPNNKEGTCIDHLFFRNSLDKNFGMRLSLELLPLSFTDHFCIFLVLLACPLL